MMLEGRSISDICINDYTLVSEAISKKLENTQEPVLDLKSALSYIIENDSYRKKMLEMINFVDQTLLIRHDLNMNGTIGRAFELNATKSIKVLLEYIIEHENNHEYSNLIMLDIIPIIERRNFEINLFFSRSLLEGTFNREENLCCFETVLTD